MIGIIGAMKVELEALKARLQDVTVTRISGVDFYSGKLHGTDVVAAVSGVGKVFSAVCAQTMVLKFGVKAIINTGVAGGLSPNLKLGEVAIASQVCQHDMDTSGVGDPKGLISGINKVFIDADPLWVAKAEKAAQKLGIHTETGVIASGDQFVCDTDRKAWIRDFFRAEAVEMEGAAIGQVCFVNEIPFVVIRSISDDASGHAPVSYESFFKEAAQRAVALTEEMLKEAREHSKADGLFLELVEGANFAKSPFCILDEFFRFLLLNGFQAFRNFFFKTEESN